MYTWASDEFFEYQKANLRKIYLATHWQELTITPRSEPLNEQFILVRGKGSLIVKPLGK